MIATGPMDRNQALWVDVCDPGGPVGVTVHASPQG